MWSDPKFSIAYKRLLDMNMTIQSLLGHFVGLLSRDFSVQRRNIATNHHLCAIVCVSPNLIAERSHA